MIAELPPPLRRAVSPYTGIVRSVEECLAGAAEPRLFQASCDVGDEPSLLGARLAHLAGVGGTGRSRAEAAAASVGEAIERYSASYVPQERLVVAAARELAGAVEPERFALFSERQLAQPGFRFRPFTSGTVTTWVDGEQLPGGERAWLPAELVFLGPAGAPRERPIGYATSSGLACADRRDESVVRGLCEVLERDAFMIVWANRLSLPVLELGGARLEALEEPFRRTGHAYAAVDLSPFHGFPIVLGVVRARDGFLGALGVGAAAAASPERAWWKALAEAFATRAAGAALTILAGGVPPGAVVSFEDHIRYYADGSRAAATAFLDGSGRRTPLEWVPVLEGDTPSEQIEALCRRVHAAGAHAYAVDVTSPDVAALGLTVTRVVTPELCRLDVAHDARFLGSHRLYEAAAALGLRDEALREEDVNPDPHPFP